jgi:hypothetical protein
MLRGAAPNAATPAQIQFRSKGAKRWRKLRTVNAGGQGNYLNARVRPPRSGSLRLSWRNGAKTQVSRAASITVR